MKNFLLPLYRIEQYLYDLAIQPISILERLHHLFHAKVKLASFKKAMHVLKLVHPFFH